MPVATAAAAAAEDGSIAHLAEPSFVGGSGGGDRVTRKSHISIRIGAHGSVIYNIYIR